MANQKLFIQDATNESGLVGRSTKTTYHVVDGHLTIWRRGRQVAERFNVKDGDAFIVPCNRGKRVTITDFLLPQNNWDALMRLLGFNRRQQTKSMPDYTDARYDLYRTHPFTPNWIEYGTYEIEKGSYSLLFTCQDGRADKSIIAYADPDIQVSKGLVLDVLYSYRGEIGCTKHFFYKVLRERFGFDEQDIEDVDLLETTGDICYSDTFG